jgi:hypothetical protein
MLKLATLIICRLCLWRSYITKQYRKQISTGIRGIRCTTIWNGWLSGGCALYPCVPYSGKSDASYDSHTFYTIGIFYNTFINTGHAHGFVFMQCYTLITVVKKNSSDIIAVVNIYTLSLCWNPIMARTMGRNTQSYNEVQGVVC